jgi:peptide deformylase
MLTMEDIIREGHPTLRQQAEPVHMPPSEKEQEELKEMMQFLRNSQNPEIAEEYSLRPGVGLAAPQINISKRMIVVRTMEEEGEAEEYAFFNPKIVSHSQETTYLESGEGCLSVDRAVEGVVPRYSRIKIEAFNINGEKVKYRFRGYKAIVFQHEIDHLDGIMFYDRIEGLNDKFKKPVPSKSVVIRSENETCI